MFNSLQEVWQSCMENLFMLIPAALISTLVTYLGTKGEILLCWLIMSTIDCAFGIIIAFTARNFSPNKLFKWLGKIFVQFLLIFLTAMLFHVVNLTIGIEQFFTNWLLLFFILLDFSSISNKLMYFGMLPKPLEIILEYLRHRFAKAFSVMLDSPGAVEELEKALSKKDSPNSPSK